MERNLKKNLISAFMNTIHPSFFSYCFFYMVKTFSFSGQQSHQAGSWPDIVSIPLYLWTIVNLAKESFFSSLGKLAHTAMSLWYFLFQKVHGVSTTLPPPAGTTHSWACSHFWLGELPSLLCILTFSEVNWLYQGVPSFLIQSPLPSHPHCWVA